MKLKNIFLIALMVVCSTGYAQILKPVKWTFSSSKVNDSTANLYMKASIEKDWHLYSQTIVGEGPSPTTFTFEKSNKYQLVGKVYEPKGITEFDENFGINITYFKNSATFVQTIRILSDKDFVVKGDYAASCQTLPGTAAVVNAVKKDKYGLGYGGAAYAEGVKHCSVAKDDKSQAYKATAETVASSQYPITRYLYMYLRNRPTGEIKKYIDWILSPDGQKLVTEIGYFPVK